MRLMFDSTRPMEIPATAQMVLVYVDGIYAGRWAEERVQERFKYAKKVTCSAIGRVQAQVYDVEPGCIWPMENVLPLVARDWTQGLNPTVYLNEQNHWQAARRMFRERFGREPLWFVANYDGDPTIPDGAIAKQYAHPADPPGSSPSGPWELAFHADVSAVRDYWPGVDAEHEQEEEELYAFNVQTVQGSVIESETEIVWPPLNGATGVSEAWVAGFVPAGVEATFKYAHWNNANGERMDGDDGLNYAEDGSSVVGPAVIPGKRAPQGAAKLVLVYTATAELKFTVEVR